MTRYGVWHLAGLDQVRDNLASGVVEGEETVAFDTTHIEAHSHCANVVRSLGHVLADDAYRHNHAAVARFGQQARLIVPVHGRTARAGLADRFHGIERFTPSGVQAHLDRRPTSRPSNSLSRRPVPRARANIV